MNRSILTVTILAAVTCRISSLFAVLKYCNFSRLLKDFSLLVVLIFHLFLTTNAANAQLQNTTEPGFLVYKTLGATGSASLPNGNFSWSHTSPEFNTSFGCPIYDPVDWFRNSGLSATYTFNTPVNDIGFLLWGSDNLDSVSVTIDGNVVPTSLSLAVTNCCPNGFTQCTANPSSFYTVSGNVVTAGVDVHGGDLGIIVSNNTPYTSITLTSNSGSGWGLVGLLSTAEFFTPDPTLDKSVNPTTISDGSSATYTWTIDNTAANAADQTGLGFTDTLPSSLVVANPNNIVNNCGAAVTATLGSGVVDVSGGSLAAASTCTISVDVTNVAGQLNTDCSTNPAAFTNSGTNITEINNLDTSSVTPTCLVVSEPSTTLSATKVASTDPVTPGVPFDYVITVTDTADGVDATDVVVTDTLDAALTFSNVAASGSGTTDSSSLPTVTCSWSSISDGGSETCTITVVP